MNRPDALNALTFEMSDEVVDAFRQANEDNDINVIVFSGNGRGFQVGADMKEAARLGPGQPLPPNPWGGLAAPAGSLKPVVGAINGICAGGGLIMLGGCDVVICSDDAVFFDPHVDVGWLPLNETYGTASSMAYHIAMRVALMGNSERMTAPRAYEVGLVSEVLPRERLAARAFELAEIIAGKAPLATKWIRYAMRHVMINVPHEKAIEEAEMWMHQQINRDRDGREGPKAFAEKRKPQWTGEGGPRARPVKIS